jgi:hypothetical protein
MAPLLQNIKTDDALTAQLWSELTSVTVDPSGAPFEATTAIRAAYKQLMTTTPAGGVYCIATQRDGDVAPRHHWFRTAEGACTYAIHASVVNATKGIWYATASYTEEPTLNKYGNPSRSTKNVVGVGSFWVDLDVAKPIPENLDQYVRQLAVLPNRQDVISQLAPELQVEINEYLKELDKYDSQESARKGLNSFVHATKLQPTLVLSSGRGVHAYWKLNESLTANAWRSVADKFKSLTQSLGLKADPMRTADAASLMRLCGTWHRKGEPLEVKVIEEVDRDYTYGEFEATVTECLRNANPTAVLKSQERAAPTGVAAAILRPSEFPPANAELVASKCLQVNHFRKVRGNVDEPVWYLMAGTVGHCINGEAFFQEWSSGHPQYSAAATSEKIIQWKDRTTGPSSCAAFESKNPSGCTGCKFKGKVAFPLQLGAEADELLPETPDINIKPIGDIVVSMEQSIYKPPLQIGSFRRTVKGIQVVDDNLPAPITICDYDVWVSRNARDLQNDVLITNVCYRDPHGDIRETQIKCSIMADPKSTLTWLYDQGIFINPEHAKAMTTFLQAMIRDMNQNVKTIPLHASMGWAISRDVEGREQDVAGFVIGNRLATKNGVTEAGISSRIKVESKECHSRGSLDRWVSATEMLARPGFEMQAFVLMCGFGSPFMRYQGMASATAISLLGETGAGKTSVGSFAASIWGYPKDMLRNWTDTKNSLRAHVSKYKNIPVLIDECTDAVPEEISHFIYDFSNGKDKSRLKSDATSANVDRIRHAMIGIFTTNTSLLEKTKAFKADNSPLAARIMEFRIEKNHVWQDFCGEVLSDLFESDYGLAGEVFMTWVLNNEELVQEKVKQMKEQLSAASGVPREGRFWIGAAASAVVGGIIAKQLGLIKFDLEPVIVWLIQYLKDNAFKLRNGTCDPIETMGSFLAEHTGKIITATKCVNGVYTVLESTTPRVAAVGRYEQFLDRLYIHKSALEKWITSKHLNVDFIVGRLTTSNIMERQTDRVNLMQGVNGAPPMIVPCYRIVASKLGGGALISEIADAK